MSVEIEWDEDALRDAVQGAFEEHLATEGFGYECPECGSSLILTTGENTCPKCGFVINAVPGELEL